MWFLQNIEFTVVLKYARWFSFQKMFFSPHSHVIPPQCARRYCWAGLRCFSPSPGLPLCPPAGSPLSLSKELWTMPEHWFLFLADFAVSLTSLLNQTSTLKIVRCWTIPGRWLTSSMSKHHDDPTCLHICACWVLPAWCWIWAASSRRASPRCSAQRCSSPTCAPPTWRTSAAGRPAWCCGQGDVSGHDYDVDLDDHLTL